MSEEDMGTVQTSLWMYGWQEKQGSTSMGAFSPLQKREKKAFSPLQKNNRPHPQKTVFTKTKSPTSKDLEHNRELFAPLAMRKGRKIAHKARMHLLDQPAHGPWSSEIRVKTRLKSFGHVKGKNTIDDSIVGK
jgi:hypothetical protein